MLKYIYPQIPLAELRGMLGYAALGAIVASCYGFLHDQITYTISPEYFLQFKFHQFAFADFGLPKRLFVGIIGILATWWVGMIGGWVLARRHRSSPPHSSKRRQILRGFAAVFTIAVLAGLLGYAYGIWRGPNADYRPWESTLRAYQVTDKYAFIRVAYIHNASYIGGGLGIVMAFLMARPVAATD
ncbi:MAG: hypothetical protein R3B84_16785 [Zavarzinella sp.]